MTQHALLLTDLVDSTLVGERLGQERSTALWAEHDRRARDLLARHGGREIDRTDGFLLIFDDVAMAARYALAYQRAVAELDLSARVGLHVSPLVVRENAPADVARGARRIDADGLGLPVVARVMALARGGQTLLTASARVALSEALPAGAAIESHGHYRLKGVEAPLEVFELGMPDTAPFTPPADVEKAYRVVHVGDFWSPVRSVRNNLPAERDSFVNRHSELRALPARLDGGARLLTVVGPGGTGKTRFVRRYGRTWLGDWPGGVYFCDLSEARSLDGIYFAVSTALGAPLGREDPAVQLGHAIAGRGRCLIILDNFEQVVAHAAATVGCWLDRASDAAFIVTSRERLHLGGEEIVPVEPLLLDKDAIELFALRAKAQQPDFVLDQSNRAAVAEVVRLLDGLPLAIELAAARSRLMSPAQLVERMRDRFQVLAGGGGATTRQATLKAAIDWSWELLTPWEQAALAQASVFEGGFTLAAAEAVFDLSSWADAPAVMDVVQSLVDKSLLRSWVPDVQGRHALGEPRFGMYLSIRDYAATAARANGGAADQAAQQRHGKYFAGFGTDEAINALSVHGAVLRQWTLQLELDNIVAACRRALVRGDAATAVATYRAAWQVFALQGPLAVGAALGAEVAAMPDLDESMRDEVHLNQAQAAAGVGRTDEARDWLERALSHARQRGDRGYEAKVLGRLGSLSVSQRRLDEGRERCEAAVAIHRELGNRQGEAQATADLAITHHEQGRIQLAHDHYALALDLLREVGNRRNEGVTLGNLANLYAHEGRFDDARSHYDLALAIHMELGNRRSEGIVLGNLGELHDEHGLRKEALSFYDSALRIALEIGDRAHEAHVRIQTGRLLLEEGRVDEARSHFDQALTTSRAMRIQPMEGMAKTGLGELLFRQGGFAEARGVLGQGETLLRELGDKSELAALLCVRGRLDLAEGDVDAARRALAEAEATPATAGAGHGTRLYRGIASLRDAIAKR